MLNQQEGVKKKCALLVEDDPIHQLIHSRFLTDLGYQVEITPNATSAIKQIKTNEYDLILTDLGLPDQSGEVIIQITRDFLANHITPLIVVTAHGSVTAQKKCIKLGADAVVIKPISKKSLAKVIDRCIGNPNIEANLTSQFQMVCQKGKELFNLNPFILPTQDSLEQFMTKLRINTNKAIYILEEYQQWVAFQAEREE